MMYFYAILIFNNAGLIAFHALRSNDFKKYLSFFKLLLKKFRRLDKVENRNKIEKRDKNLKTS